MTVTAATIFLAVLYVVQSFPLTCNNSTQFDCQTSDAHRCIPLEWLCDGLKDCTNGLDESHCSYLHTCPEGDFICRSGDCVSSHYKCDGEVDCPGGEDENGCEFFSAYEPASSVVHTACHANMFQCRHGPCIAKAYICDGEMDCPLGEDERNCTKPGESPSQRSEPPVECNNPGMVMCADHTACFPKHWICDGEADCLDESDESDCALSVDKFLAESVTELCHPGEHRCDGGSKCIPMNRTCDGKLDCPDGDDEGPLYRCTCAPGYRLGPDGHSCRLDRDNEGTLFVALGHEVRTMPLFESRTSHEGYETAQSLGSHGVVRSIDFVVNRQLIYLAISGSDHRGEVAVSVGGLLRVVRENIIGVGQIAVDWMGSNFFLTQRYPSLSPGISVCTQDGFFCRKIVKGQVADMNDPSKRQHYQGIALHPQRGAMVWIESYANRNRIMSANMDGTNVRVLVENKLEYPTGIAIDMITSDVYFGDVEREMIERVNLDTRERTVVLTQGVHHPYDLKYFNGFLYWSDWGSSSLKVAELSIHHSSAHLIHSFTALPFGLAINHSMYQPSPSSFPCQFTSCQWMCVSIPNAEGDLQAKCLCPDGYVDKQDGDCAPLRESVVEDVEGITDEDIHKTVVLDLSHVGVAWMKERCDNGDGCLNGGECQDIKNEHGRVTKIVCNCPAMYEGDRCERKNPFEEESSQFMPSSRSMFFPLLFTAVFVLFIGVAFVLSYRYIDEIGKASKTVTNLVERRAKRIPPILSKILPFIHSIRDRFFTTVTGARNLHRKGSGVLRKDFSNPLFNDDRSSTGSAPEEAPTNELAYSNPIFADENTHAAPFSGIQVTYTNKFAT
nr:Low density lipoprotein-receptor and Low-density lipoprotein receptor domain containing protein [Haemonchus contortus]